MASTRDPLRWLPALAIAILAYLALFPISSVDAYYHLATGRRILDEGAIPWRGVGSATFGAEPWHDNEWGFQLVAALLGRSTRDADGISVLTRGGAAALVVLRALCLAATLALLSGQMARAGVEPLTRAVGVALAAFLTFGNLFWDVRPQILSYLGFAAVGYLLERDRRGSRWAAWAILPVVAAWANAHGAFVIGIALVGTEACGEIAEGWVPGRRDRGAARRGGKLLAVAVASVGAACLNPHGYQQVLHPFLYILHPEIHEANVEWERPDLLHLPLFLMTAAVWITVLAARGRARIAEILKGAAFLALLSTAIRHLPLATLVLVPALAEGSADAARRGGWRRHLEPTGRSWGRLSARLAAAAAIVAAIVALSGARFIGPLPRFEERMVRTMPERAVRFLAREGVEGSGFNAYRFGGFLMYRLYPQERVFLDGRNDLYGTFRQEVYDRILFTEPGWRPLWEDAVERYRIGWVLLDEGEPLVAALREDPRWLKAPGGGAPVTDGVPGESGVVLLLENTSANRERLPSLIGVSHGRESEGRR